MADVFTPAKRSQVMGKIRSKDTKPEMRLRRRLHSHGFRYRLHDQKLPGKPDVVLPKLRTVIQVRGCFWHGHTCLDGHIPKSNQGYWKSKLIQNKFRDQQADSALNKLGWRVLVVWECEVEEAADVLVQVLRERQET